MVKRKGYWVEQERNLTAALKTRIASLMTGAKGAMLNCRESFQDSSMFERPMVIELRHIGDDDEKAFLMGLIITRLYEYRESHASTSGDFRHLLVIEEAHRLLADVSTAGAGMESANMRGKGVSSFIDMLSEIRAYGQGVAVVDQVPGRLHPYIVKGTGTKIVHRLLAKDDREMVGHTMGLDEDQMADLGLLDCGQCIFHQDGVRKAFLCKVTPMKTGAATASTGLNPGTRIFRESNISSIESGAAGPLASGLPMSGLRTYHDSLMKAIAAAVFSSASEIAKSLNDLSRGVFPELPEKAAYERFVRAMWQQIAVETWSFSGGEYASFLRWRDGGAQLLDAWLEGQALEGPVDVLRLAAGTYFQPPEGNSLKNLTSSVYDQLITRFEVLVNVAHDSAEAEIASQGIGFAIARAMHALFPGGGFVPSVELVSGLAFAIAARVTRQTNLQEKLAGMAVAYFKNHHSTTD